MKIETPFLFGLVFVLLLISSFSSGMQNEEISTNEVSYELDIPDQFIKLNMTKLSQTELQLSADVEEHISQLLDYFVIIVANQIDDRPVDTVTIYSTQINTTTGLWERSMSIDTTTPRYLYTKSLTLSYERGLSSEITFDQSRYVSASIDLGSEYSNTDQYTEVPAITSAKFTKSEYNTSLEVVEFEIIIESTSGILYPYTFVDYIIYVTVFYPESGVSETIETGYSFGKWSHRIFPEDYWGTSVELIEVEIKDISGKDWIYRAGQNFTRPSAVLNNTFLDSNAPVLNSISVPSSVEAGQNLQIQVNATEDVTRDFRGEMFIQYGDQYSDDVNLYYFDYSTSETITISTRDGMTSPISIVNITLWDEANNLVVYDSGNFSMPSIDITGSIPDRIAPVYDRISWVSQTGWNHPLAMLNITISDQDLRVVYVNETVIIDGNKYNFANRLRGSFPSYGVLINYWIWAELLELNIFPTEIALEKIGLTDDLRNRRIYENGVDFDLSPLVIEYPAAWKSTTSSDGGGNGGSGDTSNTSTVGESRENEINPPQLLPVDWFMMPLSFCITVFVVRKTRIKD